MWVLKEVDIDILTDARQHLESHASLMMIVKYESSFLGIYNIIYNKSIYN